MDSELISLVLGSISVLIASLVALVTVFYLRRFDRRTVGFDGLMEKALPLLEAADEVADLAKTINATAQDPDALGALIDRATSTAVLTFKHSEWGEKGGDVRLQSAAAQKVQEAIVEKVLPQVNPLLPMLVDAVFEYIGPWIGDKPERREAVWNYLIKMAMSQQGVDVSGLLGGLQGSLAEPKPQNTPTGGGWP